MRTHTLSAVACSLALLGITAAPALAGGTGGVVATGSAPATGSVPAPAKVHTFPITARTTNVAYNGPVYEKTAGGSVVPYTPTPIVEVPGAGSGKAGSDPTVTDRTTSLKGATAKGAAVGEVTAEAQATGGSAIAPAPSPAPDGPFEGRPDLLVPGTTARYVDGLAAAPMSAPLPVQEIVWAGNQLIGLPYIYGGGHASFVSPGYDCSGTVSFALHGASLLDTPEDSSEFERWGSHGAGRWVAVFSNPEHAYMTVAGLRLDTSSANDPSNLQGPRWRPLRPANEGFAVRHPLGL